MFRAALFTTVLEYLAKQIAGDGEGCTRLFEVTCHGAATREEAKKISKAVVCSSLTKAAVFGKDANWGRILCAMGYSGASFDPESGGHHPGERGRQPGHREKTGSPPITVRRTATEILSGNPVRATA